MAQEPGDEIVVSYNIKDLLAEIRDGITSIKAVSGQHELRLSKLEYTVADHGIQLIAAAPRIDQLAKIIGTQAEVKEALDDNQSASFSKTHKILATVIGVGLFALNVMTLGPDLFH